MGVNATTSVPVYADGEILEASRLNVTNSGIPVFATTTTRDAAFGGTGEKVLAEGQYAYIESTNATQFYDGAAWQNVGVSGLTLIKTQTIGTAVSSVTVTDAFSATYDAYRITINGGTGSGLDDIKFQLGSTTTGYYAFIVYGQYNSATVSGTQTNNGSSFVFAGNVNTGGLIALIELQNPFLTEETVLRAHYNQFTTTGASGLYSGFLNNNTSYTSFVISSAPATMTGGTIRVYGYQNS